MSSDDLNTNNDLYLDFNNSQIDTLLDNMSSDEQASENDDIPDTLLEATVNEAIQKLEKVLNIVALSDDDLADMYAVDTQLHDDIEVLDFDRDF